MDKVTRYAEPLLGERAYVAQQASAVEISRSRGGATLHQSVCVRLDVDPDTDDLTWDSYRNPEGRWVVTAFHGGSAVGSWLYEDVGRSVHPQDEAARALMGGGPSVVADAAADPEDLAATSALEADRGDSSEDLDSRPAHDQGEPTRPRLVSVTSDPLAESVRTAEPESESGSQDVTEAGAAPTDEGLFDEPAAASGQSKATANNARSERTKRAKGKRGRASVPSWDEILFGATKSED